MNQQRIKQRIVRFLTGEYFTDALRITLSIIIPAGTLFAFGLSQPAIGVAHGALLIALTDGRGTIEDKRTTSVVSIILFFVVSLLTIAALPHPWLLGVVFFAVTLGCSLLTAYGSRMSITGTAAIVLMIFIWGLKPAGYWFCLYLLMGGIWYYAVSLLHLWLWPERYLRYAISDCLRVTHEYLKVKALFYDTDIALEDCYKQAILSHNRVSEAQQQLRSILLRDKAAMHRENSKGQALLHVAEKTIDLYEQITAIHYDYDFLRNQFAITGALDLIQQMIRLMAADLHQLSEIKPFSTPSAALVPLADRPLSQLTARFEYLIRKESPSHAAILSRLLANLTSIYADIQGIYHTLHSDIPVSLPPKPDVEYHHFAPFENLEWKQLVSHFKISSPIFRFSLRLALTCLFCYVLAQVFALGTYSYWILITVVVIIKPAFSLTRERNIQRLTGTLAGIAVALCLLFLIGNTAVLLVWGALFLLIYFTFNRTHHLLSVIALTPMVIIIVYTYGNSSWSFILERIYDTLIGCAIAFGATYLFPSWESSRVLFLCRELLKSNVHYLETLDDVLSGNPINLTAYKLARKSVYLEQATLSQSFQRMLREPGNQTASEYIYRFQILNHILSASIASLFRALPDRNDARTPTLRNRVNTVRTELLQGLLFLSTPPQTASPENPANPVSLSSEHSPKTYEDPFFLLKTVTREIRICCLELRSKAGLKG